LNIIPTPCLIHRHFHISSLHKLLLAKLFGMGLFSKRSKPTTEATDSSSPVDDKHTPGVFVEKTNAARPDAEAGDYSGAVAKTDPEEMKLVRKLDIRIMSILWAMYFL
jgi:hypothetical protein